MFKKYISKLTNTVGTVQYLNKLAKDNNNQPDHHHHHHHHHHASMILEITPAPESTAQIYDPPTDSPPQSAAITHITVSAAIINLRNTLLYYSLVFIFDFDYLFRYRQNALKCSGYSEV